MAKEGTFRGPSIVAGKVKSASLHAVVTRADGRVEDLGQIAYYHRNPIRRLAHKLARLIRRGK